MDTQIAMPESIAKEEEMRSGYEKGDECLSIDQKPMLLLNCSGN